MAHCGCYVPATFASFRLVDHLFTSLYRPFPGFGCLPRPGIGTGDSIENNASSFMQEMREVTTSRPQVFYLFSFSFVGSLDCFEGNRKKSYCY